MASSRSGLYATGTLSAPTRRTGASRCSKSSPAILRRDFPAEAAHHLIFVRDDDAVGAPDVGRDRIPVVRRDRAQVEDGDADMVLFGLLRRQDRSLNQRAPRDDEDVIALATQARAAERDHEIFARILAFVVRLAVQVLMLEEQHRVLAANRRTQQACRVHGVRGVRNANARAVGEDALA